jgi:glycosyltransferase involved in cell wall biosynthesis
MTKCLYIITSNFPPVNIVGALRPYRLAKNISNNGWKVIIVTFLPKNDSKVLDFTLLDALGDNIEINYVNSVIDKEGLHKIKQVREHYKHFTTTNKLSFIHNKFNKYYYYALTKLQSILQPDPKILSAFSIYRCVKKSLNTNNKNVIFTTSPPHSLHIAGLLLKRLTNVSWIVDFRDPWDTYPQTGKYENRHPVNKYFEKKILNKCDVVISTTCANTKILKNRHKHLTSTKFHTITNSYDSRLMSYKIEKSPDHFIISYTGIFYPEKNPYAFFRALNAWFEKMDNTMNNKYRKRLKVHLIGAGDRVTRQIISELNLENEVFYIDRVAHVDAIRLTKQSDMVLVSTGTGDKTRPGWLPSKFIEYLGCGVPILAITREGEMAKIIRETKAGNVVTSENHKEIQQILENAIDMKFDNNESFSPGFTFEGVDRFEEVNVFNNMIEIIENI